MNKATDLGLLVIRLGVGGALLGFRGLSNLAGGSEVWAQNGSFIFDTSFNLSPEIVGLSFAIIETIGAILIITGALFRTGTILLLLTLVPTVFFTVDTVAGSSYTGIESKLLAVTLVSVLVGFLISGPGSIAMHPFRRRAEHSDDDLPSFESLS